LLLIIAPSKSTHLSAFGLQAAAAALCPYYGAAGTQADYSQARPHVKIDRLLNLPRLDATRFSRVAPLGSSGFDRVPPPRQLQACREIQEASLQGDALDLLGRAFHLQPLRAVILDLANPQVLIQRARQLISLRNLPAPAALLNVGR
jgi:hypothetical protein